MATETIDPPPAAAPAAAPPSPPPAMAEGFISDVIEYHSDVLVHGCEEDAVAANWESLCYFWRLFSGGKANSTAYTVGTPRQELAKDSLNSHGRICNRKKMAEIIYYACHLDPYDKIATTDDNNVDDIVAATTATTPMIVPMSQWNPKHWQWLQQEMHALRNSLLRVDASVPLLYHDQENQEGENCANHDRRFAHRLFTNKYDKVDLLLKVNEHISIIRRPMEEQLLKNSSTANNGNDNKVDSDDGSGREPEIPKADLELFRLSVQDDNSQRVRIFLGQFVRGGAHGKGPSLAPVEELREAVESDGCALLQVQGKVLNLLREWSGLVFNKRLPALRRLGYGDPIVISAPAAVRSPVRVDDDHNENNPPTRRGNNRNARNHNKNGDEIIHNNNDDSSDDHGDKCYGIKRRRSSRNNNQGTKRNLHNEENLRGMRDARKKLGRGLEDPLPDTIVAAGRAAAPPRPKSREDESSDDSRSRSRSPKRSSNANNNNNLQRAHQKRRKNNEGNKRKASAESLLFDSSEDEEEEYVNVTSPVNVSRSVKRSNSSTKRERSSGGRGNNNYSSTKRERSPGGRGEPQQRKRFTDEEKEAIIRGVRDHGIGKWNDIKADYARILRDRTNVQIKDCYRTMKNNGTI